jgi:hypothetical protein
VLAASIRVDARVETDIRAVVVGKQRARRVFQVLSLDRTFFVIGLLEYGKVREPLEAIRRIVRRAPPAVF